MEICKPGGFLLFILDRLNNKNTSLDIIESKILELEKNGVTTYDFIHTGFGDERVSLELYDDLRLFVDIGWIEFIEDEYKLTKRGTQQTTKFKLPDMVENIFESVMDA